MATMVTMGSVAGFHGVAHLLWAYTSGRSLHASIDYRPADRDGKQSRRYLLTPTGAKATGFACRCEQLSSIVYVFVISYCSLWGGSKSTGTVQLDQWVGSVIELASVSLYAAEVSRRHYQHRPPSIFATLCLTIATIAAAVLAFDIDAGTHSHCRLPVHVLSVVRVFVICCSWLVFSSHAAIFSYEFRYGNPLTSMTSLVADEFTQYRRIKEEARVTGKLRFLFLTLGSRGDVQPFLGLALELQRRGHIVYIATSDNFESFVDHHLGPGCFISCGVDEVPQPDAWATSTSFAEMIEGSMQLVAGYSATATGLWKASRTCDPDVIFGTAITLSFALDIAEKLHVPCWKLMLNPDIPNRAYGALSSKSTRLVAASILCFHILC